MTVVREGYLTELQQAKDALTPLIRGLRDMLAFQRLSDESKAILKIEEARLLHRRDLIIAAIASIGVVDNSVSELEADGYPEIAHVVLPTTLFNELKGGVSDVEAADTLFDSPPVITITLGEKSDKG